MTLRQKKFRETFQISKEIINWFPSHMRNSFKHMQAKMRNVDCIVEVHDSRIPFTGRNPMFLKGLLGERPHILVLNKMDLMDRSQCKFIQTKYQEENQKNVIFTNCLNQKCIGLQKILPLAVKLMKQSTPQFNVDLRYKIMVVGIPNVGKSSFINALRNAILHKGKATAVGASPGITKAVQNEIKINVDPPVYLIDTPGILLPNILDVESGMKLALCSCLKDEIVGVQIIADFLLYWLNKSKNFDYVPMFELEQPTDDILPLLIKIAIRDGKTKKIKNVARNTVEVVPDIHYAALHMTNAFRKGLFGDIYLDKEYY